MVCRASSTWFLSDFGSCLVEQRDPANALLVPPMWPGSGAGFHFFTWRREEFRLPPLAGCWRLGLNWLVPFTYSPGLPRLQ